MSEELSMHIDESKKFDKRNIERNIKDGIISEKEYENYLSKLPDLSDKIFDEDLSPADSEYQESNIEDKKLSKNKFKSRS